jgi:FkbM family methyltransferase
MSMAVRSQSHEIRKTFHGEPLSLLIADAVAERWYARDDYRHPELAWVKEHMLRPGDVVLDCGAHQGVTGLLYARWVGPAGRVIGFEAIPSNVAIARRNIARNGATNFEICHTALGSRSGFERFEDVSNGAVYHGDEGAVAVVPIARLDELVGAEPRVDFVKIDVEGWELEVLAGAAGVLARRPRVVVELHNYRFEEPPAAVARLLQLLAPARYELWVQIERDGEVRPYDPARHTVDVLARPPVVHVYAMPR